MKVQNLLPLALITILAACGEDETSNSSSTFSSSSVTSSVSSSSSSSSSAISLSSSSSSSSISLSSSSSSVTSAAEVSYDQDSGLIGWATQHPSGKPTGGSNNNANCVVSDIDQLRTCLNHVRRGRDNSEPYTIYVKGHIKAAQISGGGRYERLDLKPESSHVSVIGVVEGGQIPTIEGVNLVITGLENLIVRNIRFIAPRDTGVSSPEGNCKASDPDYCDWNASYDAMTIQGGAQRIWIDHCEFTDGPNYQGINPNKAQYKQFDGLLDIKKGADFITISYTKFYNHDKNMLIGASDRDTGEYRVTFYKNYFKNVGQRSPRVRFGKVHVLNNLYENKAKTDESQKYYHQYAIGLGYKGQVYSEYNVFDIPGAKADSLLGIGFDKWSQEFTDVGSWLNGNKIDLTSVAESIINDREAAENQGLNFIGPTTWTPSDNYSYRAMDNINALRDEIRAHAGAGKKDL